MVKIKSVSAFYPGCNCLGYPGDIIKILVQRRLNNMNIIMPRLKIGDIAPNFSFEAQSKEIIELENIKGKIVVIFFIRSLF